MLPTSFEAIRLSLFTCKINSSIGLRQIFLYHQIGQGCQWFWHAVYRLLIMRSDISHFPTSVTSFEVWIGFPLKDISYSPLAMGVTLTKQPLAFCNSTNAPLLLPSFTISRSANSLVRLRMLHIRDRWFCHEGHSLCSRLRREPAVGVRNNII